MNLSDLKTFLTDKMSMTEIYQPVIIKELLLNSGQCTQGHLAKALAQHDEAVHEYYKHIVMRWPKQTLERKHGIVRYERKGKQFFLNCSIRDVENVKEIIAICNTKIKEWRQSRNNRDRTLGARSSVRYRVLAQSKGKCELCGMSSEVIPIDIDHIVPQSQADKTGKVEICGKRVAVDSEENLQALCHRCNRGKRDGDSTDYRKLRKLIRDRIPDIIRQEERVPVVRQLTGKSLLKALKEKLVEEHAEYIADKKNTVEKLVDMMEVIIAIAKERGTSQQKLLQLVENKRIEHGSFERGYFYEGDL